jgi:hypothetical protein
VLFVPGTQSVCIVSKLLQAAKHHDQYSRPSQLDGQRRSGAQQACAKAGPDSNCSCASQHQTGSTNTFSQQPSAGNFKLWMLFHSGASVH